MPRTWPCRGCGKRTQALWRRCRPCRKSWLASDEGRAEWAWLSSMPKAMGRPLTLSYPPTDQPQLVLMSADHRHRYLLTRRTGGRDRAVAFIMLNPSTADAEHDDPTIQRCVGFASRWDFGWLHVVNLSPLRATNPAELLRAGPEAEEVWVENLQVVLDTVAASELVVAAWGVHGRVEDRAERVLSALDRRRIYCLGVTKEGHPQHPLYRRETAQLALFRG